MINKESIDYWFSYISNDENQSKNIFDSLKKEPPLFISWIGERSCNLQCRHCIFQKEESYGENKNTGDVLLNIASSIAKYRQPTVIHEGRILRKWHLPILKKLQDSGANVGLIDNGTYTRHIHSFERKIDWLDISIDGTENIHNKQRNSENAYDTAIEGLKRGKEVAKKVTSLMTITSINYSNIYDSCTTIIDLVDELHIIPVSPVRSEIAFTETSTEQMCIAWEQIKELQEKYPEKIFVRIYQHADLKKISLINSQELLKVFRKPVGVSQGRIMLDISGVKVSYLPKSLSINETIVVDVDGWYRLPYSIAFTTKELTLGKDCLGNDVSNYSIQEITKETDIIQVYKIAVSKWWKSFGEKSLEEEKKTVLNLN